MVQLSATSASAAGTCYEYVNKAGTNVPYTMPTGTQLNSFGCSGNNATVGHSGQDFAKPKGTPVYAVATGVVVERGWEYTSATQETKGCHGKYIVVQDKQGVYSAYGHLDDVLATWPVNSTINRNDIIGYSGDSGVPAACGADDIGEHLHLSIAYNWDVTTYGGGWQSAKFTNPVTYIENHPYAGYPG